MHIISRYLINEFLKNLVMTLAGFVAIFVVVDFFEKLDNFMEAQVNWKVTFTYFLYQLPVVAQQMLPAAILLATIITLSLMARNRELITIRSCGISLIRLTYPLILLSFCFTIMLFFLNETVLPPVHEKINRIWQVEVMKKPLNAFFRNEKIWYRGKRVIYHIDYYDQQRLTLYGITIYRFSPDFELVVRVDARRGEWNGKNWIFLNGIIQKRKPDGSFQVNRFEKRELNFPETPEDLVITVRKPEEMNLRDLRAYTSRLRMEGYDASRLEVDMQAKISFPFVCVVMTLVGIPLSVRSEKRGGVAAGIGLGICVAFLYWMLYSVSITSGQSNILPPLVAGWLANAVFLASGTLLLVTMKQ